MTYPVRALARAGVVAIASDVNAAYTGNFAELSADAEPRWTGPARTPRS